MNEIEIKNNGRTSSVYLGAVAVNAYFVDGVWKYSEASVMPQYSSNDVVEEFNKTVSTIEEITDVKFNIDVNVYSGFDLGEPSECELCGLNSFSINLYYLEEKYSYSAESGCYGGAYFETFDLEEFKIRVVSEILRSDSKGYLDSATKDFKIFVDTVLRLKERNIVL